MGYSRFNPLKYYIMKFRRSAK